MRSVSVSELKARLSHFVQLTKRGEEIVVLDRNRPVAKLTRFRAHETTDAALARLVESGRARAPTSQPLSSSHFSDLPKVSTSMSSIIADEREDRF